jgi:hypothetical protein
MSLDVALIPPSNMGRSAAAHLREILENHEIAQEIARENIKLAQEKFTKQYDKKTSDPQVQTWRQSLAVLHTHTKEHEG